jgi:hypothetical protein
MLSNGASTDLSKMLEIGKIAQLEKLQRVTMICLTQKIDNRVSRSRETNMPSS